MSIDLLKIGRVVMSFLFSRIWVVTTLVLLSGCAASLEQLQIMDKSAGFNKTIVSKTRITLLGEILDQKVIVGDRTFKGKAKSEQLTWLTQKNDAIVKLEGTHFIKPEKPTHAQLAIQFKRLGILWNETDNHSFIITAEEPAKIVASPLPECIHVGDNINFTYRLDPTPIYDKFSMSPFLQEASPTSSTTCISIALNDKSASGVFTAKCISKVKFQMDVPERPALVASKKQIIDIKPALIKPTEVRAAVGQYVKPDGGGTEQPGGGLPNQIYRAVDVSWKPPVHHERVVLEIFELGSSIPVESSLFDSNARLYPAKLAAGKRYFAKLRARYNLCEPNEWSPFIIYNFDVPS